MASVNVYKLDGSVKASLELPASFAEEFRPDLIRKAVNTSRANARQPYGAYKEAGKRRAVIITRPGRGMARTPRLRAGGPARFVPNAVGGRRSHPPKAEKDWSEKINVKENAKAVRSALAAAANKEIVSARGHKFDAKLTLPLVVDDAIEKIAKTTDLVPVLEKLGIWTDVERARDGTHVRAGRGKMRGRVRRTPTSILVVTRAGAKVHLAARNLPGVTV
ncbi:MAG: 50S ribosomal protein L4, partial [Methanobacteriota archaeon]